MIEKTAELDRVSPLSNARRSRRDVGKIGIWRNAWNPIVHLEVFAADSECSEVTLVRVAEAGFAAMVERLRHPVELEHRTRPGVSVVARRNPCILGPHPTS